MNPIVHLNKMSILFFEMNFRDATGSYLFEERDLRKKVFLSLERYSLALKSGTI